MVKDLAWIRAAYSSLLYSRSPSVQVTIWLYCFCLFQWINQMCSLTLKQTDNHTPSHLHTTQMHSSGSQVTLTVPEVTWGLGIRPQAAALSHWSTAIYISTWPSVSWEYWMMCAVRHVCTCPLWMARTLESLTIQLHDTNALFWEPGNTHRDWSDVRPWNTPSGSSTIWLLVRYLRQYRAIC
jgi:hypothetical protein